MKHFISSLLILCAALVPSAAKAQDILTNNPDNAPYFGIRAGLDIACPGDISVGNAGLDFFKNGAGFNVGGIYNFPVIANFYVEPGVSLFYNTYGVKSEFFDIIDDTDFNGDGYADNIGIRSMSVRKFGIRIPVMAGYHFDFTPDLRLHVFTGPELEIGIKSKLHAKINRFNATTGAYGNDGFLKRVDCSWDFGVGLQYSCYYVNLTGAIGMCNMINKIPGATYHENRVSLNLGYNF